MEQTPLRGRQHLGKLALAARYGLSKNTFLYTGIATGDLKEHISQKRVVQLGMRTAF
jgi:GBP family porin